MLVSGLSNLKWWSGYRYSDILAIQLVNPANNYIKSVQDLAVPVTFTTQLTAVPQPDEYQYDVSSGVSLYKSDATVSVG